MRRNRKAAPPLPKRTIYTRKSKGLRRYNRGYLNLQRRLQSGSSLPHTTFARFYFRCSQTFSFDVAGREYTGTSPNTDPILRTIVLNDVGGSPIGGNQKGNLPTDPAMDGQIMYKDLWASLYEQFQILGAKLRLRIKPAVYPATLAGVLSSSNATTADHVPVNAQPGYYYIRVSYVRDSPPGYTSNSEQVGHPIRNYVPGNVVDLFQENYWPHERDFLADPTVIWKRDKSSLRSKIHLHADNQIQTNSTSNYSNFPTTSTSYELECNNKPITLTCKFSAKKHFQTLNILRNGKWCAFNTNLNQADRFYVRFGYIGFYNGGKTAYHIPIDRSPIKVVDVDISYFAALRGPKVYPTMYNDPEALNALKVPEEIIDIDEDGSDFTDEEEDYEKELATNTEEN
ncbi:MAG: hypothetical protein QXL01_06965 [Thermoplasmatales archaeon]